MIFIIFIQKEMEYYWKIKTPTIEYLLKIEKDYNYF